MVTIIKEDENQYVALRYIKDYGYHLDMVVKLEWAVKELQRKNIDHEIMTDKELKKTNRHLYTIYEVLKILQKTNDGNRLSPWLDKETFEELIYCFGSYSEWDLKWGQYKNELRKYREI